MIKRTFWSDVLLAGSFVFDLCRLYLLVSNKEVAHYNVLFALACGAQPKTIVELGTGPGVSTRAFARVLRHRRRVTGSDCRLHSCDIDPRTIRRAARLGSIVQTHLMTTDALAAKWATDRKSIDLLFIDADHSHEQSLKDFNNFAPFVVPNGLVLMHDVHPLTPMHEQSRYSGEVYRTAKYIKDHYRDEFEFVSYPHLCGIGIARKRGGKYF